MASLTVEVQQLQVGLEEAAQRHLQETQEVAARAAEERCSLQALLDTAE